MTYPTYTYLYSEESHEHVYKDGFKCILCDLAPQDYSTGADGLHVYFIYAPNEEYGSRVKQICSKCVDLKILVDMLRAHELYADAMALPEFLQFWLNR